jgi:hypothetical protein
MVAGAALQLAAGASPADLATFLGRAARLDPAALVRLRSAGGWVTAYVRLPFGVLVSRSAPLAVGPADLTVRAGDLADALGWADPHSQVPLPAARDLEWRGPLPPTDGWQRVDAVPAEVVLRLVHAGAAAARAAVATSGQAGETLLDHESLTVSGDRWTIPVPLRVLSALWRMGFLGAPDQAGADPVAAAAGDDRGGDAARQPGSPPVVVVSVRAGWVRMAATYGTAYHQLAAGLTPLRRG